MVLVLLSESDLDLPDDVVEMIIERTLTEVDGKGDGKIDEEVWKAYAARNSSLLKHITQTSNHICHCLNDSRVSMVT
ncbi:calcineurin B-like protein 7 [Cucurbita moschata]|uniref:Calcineurin B-like protein n=2 Tax=Cucurbita TaxID=3660 RepID=A0A6J1FNQ9_CUCMO